MEKKREFQEETARLAPKVVLSKKKGGIVRKKISKGD